MSSRNSSSRGRLIPGSSILSRLKVCSPYMSPKGVVHRSAAIGGAESRSPRTIGGLQPIQQRPKSNNTQSNKILPSAKPAADKYGYNRVQLYGVSTLKAPEKFAFIWALKNFSEIRDQKTEITSQDFADSNTHSVWRLKVIPNRKETPEFLGLKLIHVGNKDDSGKLKTTFEIAILDADDSPFPEAVKIVQNFTFTTGSSWASFQSIKMEDIILPSNRILCHDTLSIQCSMCIKTEEFDHQKRTLDRNDLNQQRKDDCELHNLRLMASELKEVFTNGNFSDLELVTTSKSFQVHAMVLSARSSVFRAELSHPSMLERKTKCIKIPDFKTKVVGTMLKFLYSGEVTETALNEQAMDLLIISEKYDIKGLKSLSENACISNISLNNACQLLALAHIHNAPSLKSHVCEFINLHSGDVNKTPAFIEFAIANPAIALEIFLH